MAKDWTADDLVGMDDEKLRGLYENAQSVVERKHPKLTERAQALLPLIEAEFNRRHVNRPIPTRSDHRVPRSDRGRVERRHSDAIFHLVDMLSARYDISPETAIRLSSGIRNFKPRQALGRNGDALLGGAKTAGKVAIDRYTSYRMKSESVSLSVILEKDDPLDNLKFIVQASPSHLKNPKPLAEIRKTANDKASLRNEEFGELFGSFSTAAEFYEGLISQLAPRR